MIVDSPMLFQDALDAARVKSLLPTTGRTADVRRLDPAILRRSLWSATQTSLRMLQAIDDGVDAILSGETDEASVRLGLKRLAADEGYQAAGEDKGTMLDLASTLRLDTILDTQVGMARGLGWHQQGMQPDVLDEFPAQELYRAATPKGGADAERDWAQIWADNGGTFFGDRMIALKTSIIWKRLGDPEKYPDGLGNDFPPFRINSLMRVRDIGRDETIALGLIDDDTQLTPDDSDDLSADLQAAPAARAAWLRDAVEESGFARYDAKGVLHFTGYPEGGAS